MSTEIFLPMFYLMLQTVVVFLFSTSIRLKEIYFNKTAVGEEHRHQPFDKGSRLLKNTQRNLRLILLCSLIIFFAGHGLASSDGKELYILSQDSDPDLLVRTALSRTELFEEINGLSIAPKKEFNIIKIWLRND